ncbi:alpha-ribazole phosphatase [Nocardia jinanensis]|uniref:phosphoglycerate mutase (2,3-diphosphoglycerate-dependent) n=1 Tax=Nocardia jinanensis TaxID=382504 RepID=A0A917VKD1_9NOCA|nr:alpha-ribazole phosphatase [Nocardia jinanensis]
MYRVAPVAVPDWEIVIARHGATDWSRAGRFSGHRDIPLSAAGRAQAAELGRALRHPQPEIILSSDLGRARQTAEAIATAAEIDRRQIMTSTALREEFLGSWEGLTRAQVAAASPDGFARWASGDIGSFDGREGLVAVARRAVPVLVAHTTGLPRSSGRLVIVTHANTILALAGSFAGMRHERWADLPCPAPGQAMVLG